MTDHNYIDEDESDCEDCVIIAPPQVFCCVCDELLSENDYVEFGSIYCCDCFDELELLLEDDEDDDYINGSDEDESDDEESDEEDE
tara:strand:- start:232 stop:489 length:258 start_codon:yes stop_codon:yes gene_type:complete